MLAFDLNSILNLAGLGIVAYFVRRRLRARSVSRPPGPKPLPLIGNLLDIPHTKQWLTYASWGKQYGDVIYVSALRQKILVLNSLEAVRDVMEHRGANYSNRAESNMLKMADLDGLIGFKQYGEQWRAGRRMMHQHLHPGAILQYADLQLRGARAFVGRLMRDPADISDRIRVSFGGTVMKLTYDIDVREKDDPYVEVSEVVQDYVNSVLLPGKYLVDVFGILKYVPSWVPGAGFQREAASCRVYTDRLRREPVEYVKNDMAAGTGSPSMTRGLLSQDPKAEELISDVVGTVYLAGNDVIVSSLTGFFLALVMYPDVQVKGQKELDAVVGIDRLPSLEDRPRLPYIEAIISETLRWIPVLPLAIPHAAAEADEYRGYYIPKGTIVIGNVWAILHDPEAYPDPERFRPERFLKTNGDGQVEYDVTVRDPRVACFGFARRICPGRWLADQACGKIPASLSEVDITDGMVSHPRVRDYDIKPRTVEARRRLDLERTRSLGECLI